MQIVLSFSKERYGPDIVLDRSIHLHRLEQFEVYEGLLEGLPTRQMNARHIRDLVDKHPNCYLISPEEKSIEYTYRNGEKYPFGEPASLPQIACVARFGSTTPARDNECDGSELVVIWFQDQYALPIDEAVLAKIKAIRWDELAVDFVW